MRASADESRDVAYDPDPLISVVVAEDGHRGDPSEDRSKSTARETTTMTAETNPNDLPAVLEQLQQADPDLLRAMLTAFVQTLMSADADAVCGAEYGIRSPDRMNSSQRLPAPGVGHPGRHDRARDPENARGQLLPRLAAGAPQTRRTGVDHGGRHLLSARGVDAADGELVERSVSAGCRSRRSRSWPRTSTPRSRRSGPARWTPARTRSSPRTR